MRFESLFKGVLPKLFRFRWGDLIKGTLPFSEVDFGFGDLLGLVIVLIVIVALVRGESPMALLRELAHILKTLIGGTAKSN